MYLVISEQARWSPVVDVEYHLAPEPRILGILRIRSLKNLNFAFERTFAASTSHDPVQYLCKILVVRGPHSELVYSQCALVIM